MESKDANISHVKSDKKFWIAIATVFALLIVLLFYFNTKQKTMDGSVSTKSVSAIDGANDRPDDVAFNIVKNKVGSKTNELGVNMAENYQSPEYSSPQYEMYSIGKIFDRLTGMQISSVSPVNYDSATKPTAGSSGISEAQQNQNAQINYLIQNSNSNSNDSSYASLYSYVEALAEKVKLLSDTKIAPSSVSSDSITTVGAAGPKGNKGDKGEKGDPGVSGASTVSTSGWTGGGISFATAGATGPAGVGVVSISKTSTSTLYTMSDGSVISVGDVPSTAAPLTYFSESPAISVLASEPFGSSSATGTYSVAVGNNSVASGDYSSAFGLANSASGEMATTIGGYSIASGNYSSAFGLYNTASGNNSSSVGNSNQVSGNSASGFGFANEAFGTDSSAFGYGNTSSGYRSSAFGKFNVVSATSSSAFGYNNTASGNAASGFGYNNTASGYGSSAFGISNISSGFFSSVFGVGSSALSTSSIAIGDGITNAIEGALQIGPSDTAKLTILSNGNIGIGTSTPLNKLTIYSSTTNTSGLRFERLTYASSSYSTATTSATSSSLRTSTIFATTGANPASITTDASGNIYTANSGSNNVSKITPAGTSTILGTTGAGPYSITIDASGNIYTANYSSNNVSKITPAGVSTILGTTGAGPFGITTDASGNVYTANYSSNNVSKITPAGTSTILGTTGAGPQAITKDASGNIYTANYNSDNVSKITPAGTSTILGTTGVSPRSINIDASANIYTANGDSNNVSKITPAGVSTILGTTGNNPYSITIDALGNTYTVNNGSNNVSKITSGGVSTIIGTTGAYPNSITIDASGNIYTANNGSSDVSKIGYSNYLANRPTNRFLSVNSSGDVILTNAEATTLASGIGDIRIGDFESNGCVQNFAGTSIAGTCSSDSRLKTEIVNIGDMVSRIANVRTVNYKWNGDSQAVQDRKYNTEVTNRGVIAQDIESLFPELVITDRDGYKQVDYTGLSIYTLAAVSQLASTTLNLMSASTTNLLYGNVNNDVNLSSYAINNIKSISSSNGSWSIDENGKIVARELCIEDSLGRVCVNAQDLRNSGLGTQSATVSSSTASTTSTTTTSNAPVSINIVLNGSSTEVIASTTTYVDQSAIAMVTDSYGVTNQVSVTNDILTNADNAGLSTGTVGTYTITYTATVGLVVQTITRIVTVE